MFLLYQLAVKMHTEEDPKPATHAYMNIPRGTDEGLTKVGA